MIREAPRYGVGVRIACMYNYYVGLAACGFGKYSVMFGSLVSADSEKPTQPCIHLPV